MTGRGVARWLPDPIRASGEDGRLLRLGDHLYCLTAEGFSEISIEDVTLRKNGWR